MAHESRADNISSCPTNYNVILNRGVSLDVEEPKHSSFKTQLAFSQFGPYLAECRICSDSLSATFQPLALFMNDRQLDSVNIPLMPTPYPLHTTHGHQYIDEGPTTELPPIVLLHGMLGDLTNWTSTIEALSTQQYRVVAPVLPVYEMPLKNTHVEGLVDYVQNFLDDLDLDPAVLVGNSLGGHVALLVSIRRPDTVAGLVLAGASGIYEVDMGTSTLRRRDRDYIRERAARTFHDPVHVTETLIDNVLDLVNNRKHALRLLRMARSAQSETVTERLSAIEPPTLLIWGSEDQITPPEVAREFQERMPNADLEFIEKCGHAPMIEHPERFNEITLTFLQQIIGQPTMSSQAS